MAKKKKNKNSQNSPSKTPPINHNKAKGSHSRHSQSQSQSQQPAEENDAKDVQYSAIALSLSPEVNKKVHVVSRSISHENDRVVSIHENDARGFCVRQGEEVIVLQIDIDVADDIHRGPMNMSTNMRTSSSTSTSINRDRDRDRDRDRGPSWSPESAKVSWKLNGSDSRSTQPRFASICRVAISQTQNNFSTPRSSAGGSATKKHKPSREGEAHILPTTLAQRIRMVEETVLVTVPLESSNAFIEEGAALGSISAPVAAAAATPSPSPAKPRFTFETFVSSPAKSSNTKTPSRNSTPQSKSKPKQRRAQTQTYMALLSLEKNPEAYRLLTGDAERLTLGLVDSSSSSSFCSKEVLQKAEQVLARMVHASCHGIYVSVGDILTISFQGKKLQFQVQDVGVESKSKTQTNTQTNTHLALGGSRNRNHVDALTRSIAELRIEEEHVKHGDGDDGDDDDNGDANDMDMDMDAMSKEIMCQLRDGISAPVLFRVIHQTRVVFKFDDEEGEGYGVLVDTSNSSTVGAESKSKSIPNHKPSSSSSSRRKIVAGLDSIADQIQSLLIPTLFHPERFPRSGPIRAPKGVLLHGTSGCGKSLLAEQVALDMEHYAEGIRIKDLNSNTSRRVVDVVRVNCASIQSSTSIMGDAERTLTRIFERAEKRASFDNISTLLLMDDIHLICPRRGAAGDGTGVERVASTLLALMDGIGKQRTENKSLIDNGNDNGNGNVAILAITTNPSLLDPALRRAGRLDTEVEIPSPDENAKSDIFSMCLGNLQRENVAVPALAKTELVALSRLAKGFTGADCALSIKEATRNAILRHMSMSQQDNGVSGSGVELMYSDVQQAVRMTKPSSIKSITVEIPKVPWSSIGGMDSVKLNLREAIELPLTHSHLFTALSIPPPRGVLLYGPPGCSKTLMARALATEGNMNFLAVKGPELLSKWLGESERALAALFRRARLASPCVIFFDEIDAIASKRGSGESSGGERMLSQLLTELDGVTASKGNDKQQPRVIVVGATNRPDLLDVALTRPGRIDRMIYVGIPDLETRKAIFALQLEGKVCDPNIDVSQEVVIFLN